MNRSINKKIYLTGVPYGDSTIYKNTHELLAPKSYQQPIYLVFEKWQNTL
jgi:hypothetical protein